MTTLCRVRNIIVPDCVDPGGRPMRATLLYVHACMHGCCSPHDTVAGQSLLAVGMHVCACCVRRAGRGLPWPPSPSRPSQTTHPATKVGARAGAAPIDWPAHIHASAGARPAGRTPPQEEERSWGPSQHPPAGQPAASYRCTCASLLCLYPPLHAARSLATTIHDCYELPCQCMQL